MTAMAPRAATVGPARSLRAASRAVTRRRRLVLLGLLVAAALVTVLLVLFLSDRSPARLPVPAGPASATGAGGPPPPFVVALLAMIAMICIWPDIVMIAVRWFG